jgi:formylglycine-generating enzyme required for sulfatase activity
LTSDGGIGKTQTLEWLEWSLNHPDRDTLALLIAAKELESLAVDGEALIDFLVKKITVPRELWKYRDSGEAAAYLIRLRGLGKLVLLIDGIDEVAKKSDALTQINALADPRSVWNNCRIVIAGRQYAFETHYSKLCPKPGGPWRFVMVDEFTPDEQRTYLGEERYNAVPEDARELLTVPRVLYYLRNHVLLADVHQPIILKSASDVYWNAVLHILEKGREAGVAGGSHAAGVEQAAKQRTADGEVGVISIEDALLMLSALAYVISVDVWKSEPVSWESIKVDVAKHIGLYDHSRKQRDPTGEFPEPLDIGDKWSAKVEGWLKQLAAMNGPLSHALLDYEFPRQIQFRNRSLREFFAGLWMSRYCVRSQFAALSKCLPLRHVPATHEWYWTFRFAAEMPNTALNSSSIYARDASRWLLSMETVFCRGDSKVAGTGNGKDHVPRRSTELIVRAWPTLKNYVDAGNLAAVSLCNSWRGEFQEILDRGHPMAREFIGSFVTIPGGTLKMGSPETDAERFDNEPEELPIEIEEFKIMRFPMLNGYYRLFDPGHGLKERDREFPWGGRYSGVSSGDRHPAVDVSWWDAKAASLWFRWRSSKVATKSGLGSLVVKLTRLFKVSDDMASVFETRLPKETELEWVAKDGSDSYLPYPWGDEDTSLKHMVPRNSAGTAVLPKMASAANHPRATTRWKIIDIEGNVWQWCDNVYVDKVETAADCERTEGGPYRASRGGCWGRSARLCRSANRNGHSPGHRLDYLGFRLALVPSRES